MNLTASGGASHSVERGVRPRNLHSQSDRCVGNVWSPRDLTRPLQKNYGTTVTGKPTHVSFKKNSASQFANRKQPCDSALAKVAGQLAWSNVCRRPLLQARLGEQESFAHGRLELPGGIIVDRYVLAMAKNGIWITDSVRSPENCDATWYWQLGIPSFDVTSTERSLQLVSGADICIKLWSQAKIHWEMHEANDQASVGWVAQSYGRQVPGQRLSVRVDKQKQLLLTTFVGPATAAVRLEQVRTKGLNLDCDPIRDQTESRWQIDEACDILWILSDGARSSMRYAVPSSSPKNYAIEDYKIEGKGDWQVLRRERLQSRQSSSK